MSKTIKHIQNKIQNVKKHFFPTRINYNLIHRQNEHRKIVFFLPDTSYATGGVIVAHHHSDKINSLKIENYQSEVLYPYDLSFSPKFFVHNSIIKRDLDFDASKDLAVIPEVMALKLAPTLIQAGINYAIHVQNGYLMNLELGIEDNLNLYPQLKKIYSNACMIIGNSLDTVENIKVAFPDCTNKIIRSYFVINKSKYQNIEHKQNLITYMPRKLSNHSKLVLFFLGDKLPKNWSIKPIDGVPEQEVYNIFFQSKIFLSFSEFEGLAMPPAMAAMAGNKVIGYTGEANKEYFHLPCFEEIPCGDIKQFVAKILEAVERFDSNNECLDIPSIDFLKDLFSEEKQEQFLRRFINDISRL